MPPANRRRAFALYEVLIGLTIFVVGVLALGKAVENCINASSLAGEENVVRTILANRMAEIQAAPGRPDAKKEDKVDSGYGAVRLIQKVVPAGLKGDKGFELGGIRRVNLTAEWTRNGITQHKEISFYVYRAG